MIASGDFDYLARQFEAGTLLLFTGAGFSESALDSRGNRLPLGATVAEELWQICFPNEARDASSSLQDLFEIALSKHRTALVEYLQVRFSVLPASIPAEFEVWFRAPWWRIYTLNVDDFELAAARRFSLPRRIAALSSLAPAQRVFDERPAPGALEVVHLNGLAKDGPEGVTFSTLQYARRQTGADRFYPQLVAELVGHPIVFVGSTLDESPLWQHIELRGVKGSRENRELRRKSFIVSPTLSRARQALLREFNVHWIQAGAVEFSKEVLSRLGKQFATGLDVLGHAARPAGKARAEVPLVDTLSGRPSGSRSHYLVGDEPTWGDILEGRATLRESDGVILSTALTLLSAYGDSPEGSGSLLLLSGTAGSGTTTGSMRLALRLSAEGYRVGWVGSYEELSPREIETFAGPHDGRRVLFIDSAERYGAELGSIAVSILRTGGVALLVLGMRAAHVDRLLGGPRLEGIRLQEIPVPLLSDADILGLLDVLEKNNLLGRLTGLDRAEQLRAFQKVADRQLLVAMIEATSGRRFEEKIFGEWEDLSEPEKLAYGLVALGYALGHRLDREQVLLASGDASNDVLNALDGLVRRNILRGDADELVRARHRLVAEKLVDELLVQQQEFVRLLHARLAFSAALRVRPGLRRSDKSWRLLKVLLNHERLYRQFDYAGATAVYDEVEALLSWDYHFRLQRGCLELEYGQVRLAENLLESAYSLGEGDHRVATAYAHMLFKKACMSPESPEAAGLAERAVDLLQEQIRNRGTRDSYPYHVLGSQGLSWVRRGRLAETVRTAFHATLVRTLQDGMKKHPGSSDLKQLLDDLRREDLMRVVRDSTRDPGSSR